MLTTDVALRIALAFAAGLLLGIERESHGRGAGLRTTALVCVAACIAMVISDSFYVASFRTSVASASAWHPDPARLAAGVLSGMGFLGAGVVVRQNHLIRGVTTAAVLWFATVIGLAFGTGAITLGLAGLAVALITLLVLPFFEQFVQNDWYSSLVLVVRADGATLADIETVLAKYQIRLKSVDLEFDLVAGMRRVQAQVKYKKVDLVELPEKVGADLSRLAGVTRIEWK